MSVWKDTWRLSKAGSVGGVAAAVAAALIVLTGLLSPVACNLGSAGYPGAGEVSARYRAHERDFAVLAQMLTADRGALVQTRGTTDLRTVAALGTARIASYDGLLTKIGAVDMRYVPGSGAVAVWVSGAGVLPSTYYLYAYGTTTKPWRLDGPNQLHGPGLYFTTRDQPLGGGWFLRREVTVPVCFSAY